MVGYLYLNLGFWQHRRHKDKCYFQVPEFTLKSVHEIYATENMRDCYLQQNVFIYFIAKQFSMIRQVKQHLARVPLTCEYIKMKSPQGAHYKLNNRFLRDRISDIINMSSDYCPSQLLNQLYLLILDGYAWFQKLICFTS